MINAVIFDLDNTLLDFMKMKEIAVKAAITGMQEAGLEVDSEKAYERIIEMYIEQGWENQQIFDIYLTETIGHVDNKLLAAGIVSYRRAREANLQVYPNVNSTLSQLIKMNIKLAVVSDAPSRLNSGPPSPPIAQNIANTARITIGTVMTRGDSWQWS